MKVYALPGEIAAPEFSFDGDWQAREAAHTERVREWLKQAGYTGKNSGKVIRFPVADGYAEYMLAEGKTSFLLHLAYGDAYQSREASLMTKKMVLEDIAAQERMDALFNRNKAA